MFLEIINTLFIQTDMDRFLREPKTGYEWKIINEEKTENGKVFKIQLISQVWQDKKWKHDLDFYQPKRLLHDDKAILLITGDKSAHDEDLKNAYLLGDLSKMNVVILYDVPNQPLFNDLREDDLVSYTFEKYLDTQDSSLPLLMPMVRSAVRAMDAVSEFSTEKTDKRISQFILTGASKRAWTTYITSATDDRVIGMAPMVFDMLRIPDQIKHQKSMWGRVSPMFAPYEMRGLLEEFDSPPIKKLLDCVDPYTYAYRRRLLMPKLIILGANDPFWAIDGLNLYWNDLPHPKMVLYVPNAGHGLEDKQRVMNTLSAFCRIVAARKAFPNFSWTWVTSGTSAIAKLSAHGSTKTRLWVAESDNLVFVESKWKETESSQGDLQTPHPKGTKGYRAVFAEAEFQFEEIKYNLSTTPVILQGR